MTKHETITHPKTAVSRFMLGRLPRAHDPRIPHLSALLAGKTLPPPPAQVDYTKSMPKTLGMMMNDTLGDCTCAAFYHALKLFANLFRAKMIHLEIHTAVGRRTARTQLRIDPARDDVTRRALAPGIV